MADQPKSTNDILAAIRNQGASGGESSETAPESAGTEAAESSAPAEKPAAASPGPSGDAPKGTADIMAAIRGGGAGAAAEKKAEEAPAPAKPAAGGAAPKGTSDILAAIRGGGGPAAAAKPAAKPKAEAKPKPAAPAGDKPSPQEMLKAILEGVKVADPDAPKKPPRLPGGKPASKASKPSRRAALAGVVAILLSPFALAWALMGVIGGIWTLAGARFMMPNMVLELPSRFKVGVASDYPLESVSSKFKASRGIWIVHTQSYNGKNLIYGLLSVCTHLGCTPSWLGGEQKFKCPCHGSGFYINGINFEGPAPRPLERVGIRVAEDGQIEIDKSVKFQEELGQWEDGKSFIEIV